MTEEAHASPSKCYEQLRKLLGNNEDSGTSFKPDSAAGFIVGAGDAAREAVPALHKLGLSPIFILHYDSREMYEVLNEFLHINLQGLRTPAMAQRELDDLKEKGTQVLLGVSTISSSPPSTPREEYVYNIAKLLLEQEYKTEGIHDDHLALPEKRCLADMLNESDALYMQKEADENGWNVGSIARPATTAALGANDSEEDKESPYWWQFKPKATAAAA